MEVNADEDQMISNAVNDTTVAAFPTRQTCKLAVRIIECIRANMEYHPGNEPPADVQIGLLGVWAATDHNVARATQALSTSGGQFFPETGQALVTFKAWWNANGALHVFGFPISPELQERNAQDGKMYTVQYFERNRLELHPEFAGTPREVMLGLLGVEYLAKQKCP